MPPSWLDLNANESIQFTSHPSRWGSFWPALGTIAATLVAVAIVQTGVLAGPTVEGIPLAFVVAGLLVFVGLLPLASAEVHRRTTWYVVTDDQVWYKSGVLSRYVDPLPLGQVVDIKVQQSALERFLFGTGTVKMANAGTGTVDMVFEDVPSPNHVAAVIRDNRDPARTPRTPQS